jgi:organic radical activating enzyme
MKIARMEDGSPEIFYTLQGEGRFTGRPSVFIRASLCNLSCKWCDTAYTWNWDNTNFEHESKTKFKREDQILNFTTDEIIDVVNQYSCRNYVFTGGEPLLQGKAWVELMDALIDKDEKCHFEIETNGTLFPDDDFLARVHQLNVSPKLANSDVPQERRFKQTVISQLAATGKADFKFVIGDTIDFDEVKCLIDTCHLPAGNIFLMPKARSIEELEANQSFVADLAHSNGLNYSDRLHLRLYGARRGV